MCWFFLLWALESRHTSQPPKNCHPKTGKNSLATGSLRDAFGYVELFHGWNWDKVAPSTDATCLPSTVINIHTHITFLLIWTTKTPFNHLISNVFFLKAKIRFPPIAQQTCIILNLLLQSTEIHLLTWRTQWNQPEPTAAINSKDVVTMVPLVKDPNKNISTSSTSLQKAKLRGRVF